MKTINEIGNIHGNLTVIERIPSNNGRAMWKCKCACGNERIESGIICDKCKKPIYKNDTYYMLDYPRWISYNDVCEDCIDDVVEYIISQIMVESAEIA